MFGVWGLEFGVGESGWYVNVSAKALLWQLNDKGRLRRACGNLTMAKTALMSLRLRSKRNVIASGRSGTGLPHSERRPLPYSFLILNF